MENLTGLDALVSQIDMPLCLQVERLAMQEAGVYEITPYMVGQAKLLGAICGREPKLNMHDRRAFAQEFASLFVSAEMVLSG